MNRERRDAWQRDITDGQAYINETENTGNDRNGRAIDPTSHATPSRG